MKLEDEFNNFINSNKDRHTWKWLNNLDWSLLDNVGTSVEVDDLTDRKYTYSGKQVLPSYIPLNCIYEVVDENDLEDNFTGFFLKDCENNQVIWIVPKTLSTLLWRPFWGFDHDRFYMRLRKDNKYHYLELMFKVRDENDLKNCIYI